MTPSRWVDHGVVPPVALPERAEEALDYLAHALGHLTYARWTFTRLKALYPSLAEAKRAKPAVFRLLLEAPEAVEWWERGRARLAPPAQAPDAASVLARLVHAHRRRFRPVEADLPMPIAANAPAQWLTGLAAGDAGLAAWLARGGRFVNPRPETNTLAVGDDASAIALFLRERAGRSRHTLRAYGAELKWLIAWCREHGLGPLSDLSRADLMAYREAQRTRTASERTRARAVAVVASLYGYWYDTGYLSVNPAAGLTSGAASRPSFVPQRFLPAAVLAACDAWVAESAVEDAIATARRAAIWALYRYAGVRLAELAWSIDTGLPRLEAEAPERWTLYVRGKGGKPRAVPLPSACIAPLRRHRALRGLPSVPAAHEVLPLIDGFKGGALQPAGLYAEVKAIFEGAAVRLEHSDPVQVAWLKAASPHWLRHAYARTLVVEHQVPLPVAQALLGHASVQTTAGYAKTDVSQLRKFVEESFAAKET